MENDGGQVPSSAFGRPPPRTLQTYLGQLCSQLKNACEDTRVALRVPSERLNCKVGPKQNAQFVSGYLLKKNGLMTFWVAKSFFRHPVPAFLNF